MGGDSTPNAQEIYLEQYSLPFIIENYETVAIINMGGEPSIYIFSQENPDGIVVLNGEEYEHVFDQKYGNVYSIMPYIFDLYS